MEMKKKKEKKTMFLFIKISSVLIQFCLFILKQVEVPFSTVNSKPKIESGKKPKVHQVTEMEKGKTLGESKLFVNVRFRF